MSRFLSNRSELRRETASVKLQHTRWNRLTRRDLDGIARTVARGVREVAILREQEQNKWTGGKRLFAALFLGAVAGLVFLSAWGYFHIPSQPLAVDAGFIEGTELTLSHSALSPGQLLINDVVGISRLHQQSLTFEVALPIPVAACKTLADIIDASCTGTSVDTVDPFLQLAFERQERPATAKVPVSMMMSGIEEMTLSRKLHAQQLSIIMRGTRQPSDGGEIPWVRVEVVPQRDRRVVLTSGDSRLGSIPLIENASEIVTLRFTDRGASAPAEDNTGPRPDHRSSVTFNLRHSSTTPDLNIQTPVSRMDIKGTKGVLDVGEKRFILDPTDTLRITMAQNAQDKIVKIDDEQIKLGGGIPEALADSVKRKQTELLPREFNVNTILSTFIGAFGAILLGLLSVFLRVIGVIRV